MLSRTQVISLPRLNASQSVSSIRKVARPISAPAKAAPHRSSEGPAARRSSSSLSAVVICFPSTPLLLGSTHSGVCAYVNRAVEGWSRGGRGRKPWRYKRAAVKPAPEGVAVARVAFVLADDFEDAEFRVPYDRLQAAGHEVTVVGVKAGKPLHGKRGKERFAPTLAAESASVEDFDALVIPGGYSPDKLRMDDHVVSLARDFDRAAKPLAAICHAGSLLIEAEAVGGRRVTSWPSIKTDLINAGATWLDAEVVEDGHLISSRKPDDLDSFCAAILRRL